MQVCSSSHETLQHKQFRYKDSSKGEERASVTEASGRNIWEDRAALKAPDVWDSVTWLDAAKTTELVPRHIL